MIGIVHFVCGYLTLMFESVILIAALHLTGEPISKHDPGPTWAQVGRELVRPRGRQRLPRACARRVP